MDFLVFSGLWDWLAHVVRSGTRITPSTLHPSCQVHESGVLQDFYDPLDHFCCSPMLVAVCKIQFCSAFQTRKAETSQFKSA